MLIGSAPKLLYALNIFLGALYVVLFVSEFGIPKYFTQKWWQGMLKALGSNPDWGLIDFSLADLWLTFHRRLRLAPNSQNPWLFLRNMPHSIYRILATIIVKIYLSFPKIINNYIYSWYSRYAMNRIFWSAQLDARIILPLFHILVLINRNI